MRRAYSYIRFSSGRQRLGDSERRQVENSRALCDRHGWFLDESLNLRDFARSAFRGDNVVKGKLGDFIQAVKDGRVPKNSILIVESLDRISRQDVPIAVRLFLEILDLGIEIVTLEPEEHYTAENLDMVRLIIAIVILSRANNESSTKSYRQNEKWKKRREDLPKPFSAHCPSWLRYNKDKDKYEAIPEKVAIVKRLFTDAKTEPLYQIERRYNKEQVPNLGYKERWNKTQIRKLLRQREVLGEYQPCRWENGRRIPIGDPVPNFYPAVIKEADWYEVQAALDNRQKQRGPAGEEIANLFTGILFDAKDGAKYYITHKAIGRRLVNANAERGVSGDYATFPYEVFERAFLEFVSGLKSGDIFPPKESGLEDQLTIAKGKLAEVSAKIEKIQKADADDIEAVIGLLKNLQAKKNELTEYIEKLTLELHHSKAAILDDTRELIGLLDTSGDRLDIRRRIKAAIANLVDEVWLLVEKGETRFQRRALVQVHFANDGWRKFVLSCQYRRSKPRWEIGIVWNLADVAPDSLEFDLRKYRILTERSRRKIVQKFLHDLPTVAFVPPWHKDQDQ